MSNLPNPDFQSKQQRERLLDLYTRAKKFIKYFGWELFALANGYSKVDELEADLLIASLVNNLPKLEVTINSVITKSCTNQGLFIDKETLINSNLSDGNKVYIVRMPNCLILTNYSGFKLLKNS